jgi:nucleotide-binding universal stress UspA family protein
MDILVAHGGAAHSQRALDLAPHLARAFDAGVTLLTVVRREADRPRGERILSEGRAELAALLPSERLSTRLRIGHPAEEIVAECEAGRYELVVVGEKHHHGLVTRFVLGATAERVVEHAPCPVAVALGRIGPPARILICDSGYAEVPVVDQVIRRLPGLLQAAQSVTVLHVMSHMSAGPGVDGHTLRADAAELIAERQPEGEILARDRAALEGSGVEPALKVRHGLVVEEIAAEAAEGDYDLVVIGAHRGAGWRRVLLGDLSHGILDVLDRPLLVMRAPTATE